MNKEAFQTFSGIVISIRKHKENDALVKIFTLEYGKRMFFIRNYYKSNHPMKAALLPFSHATYIGNIKDDGLCFLKDYKELENFTSVQQDIYANAYATYFANLSDAAIEDRIINKGLFQLLLSSYQQLDKKLDPEIIMNIYEMNLFTYFGAEFNLNKCAICGNSEGPFDYSSRFSGVLCQRHLDEDPHRLHSHPAAIHFCNLFQKIKPEQVNTISLKEDTKQAIRVLIDYFFDEYVGIKLKSKSYIDQMYEWENSLKIVRKKEKEDI